MSEEGEQETEIVQAPIREPNGKRFFVSHLNSYTGRTICKELRNDHLVMEPHAAHTFSGTLFEGGDRLDKIVDMPSQIDLVSMERSVEFRKVILSSDVIIYDLLTNKFEEVDYVIKALKTAELGDSQKTLVLISSVMTWVNTPPKFKQEGVEGGDEDLEEPDEAEGADGEQAELDANGEPIVKKKPIFFKETD